MITVLHRGGSGQMITVLHRGGLAKLSAPTLLYTIVYIHRLHSLSVKGLKDKVEAQRALVLRVLILPITSDSPS